MPRAVQEVDRVGVAAVLAADAEPEARVRLAAEPRGHPDQVPHTGRVERLERRAVEDLHVDVAAKDPTLDVVAAEPERGLGQVVGAEREEVGVARDLIGDQAGARQLDHRADRCVLDARLGGDPLDQLAHQRELALVGDQRHHHLDARSPGTRAAAANSALTCISYSSGNRIPSRTPRVPSIGLDS